MSTREALGLMYDLSTLAALEVVTVTIAVVATVREAVHFHRWPGL